MSLRVGFIGLGNMGLPMAQNILQAGFTLVIHNRTEDKAKSLIESGALWALSPVDLAAEVDILISMVSNDEALKDIVGGKNGLLASSQKPKIHISMSTVSPELTADLERQHHEKGMKFLAAPVSGRPERAKEGSLWIFLAGDLESKHAVQPILSAMSCKIFDLGEHPRQASLFKLCSNFMILGLIELFSEATALLEKEGIPMETSAKIWGSSLFDAPAFHSYTPALCNRLFTPAGFALNLGLKDMRLLRHSADSAQVSMPALETLYEKLLASMNLGREDFDWSAIMLLTHELAGL